MDYKKLKLLILCCAVSIVTKAQETDYQSVDSISAVKYLNGNWKDLIVYGKKAVANGNDFLALRLRLGYAEFQLGNYSAALVHYQQVLRDDSKNETALTYGYLSNVYLNRDTEAGYYLSDQEPEKVTVQLFSAIDAGVEAGLKFAGIATRGNSVYTRLSFSNRLGYRLTLSQSLSYFNQQVFSSNITQYEYYGKLTYVPIRHLAVKAAYHYLNSSDFIDTYHNSLGFIGLSYQFPFFSSQLDFSFGKVNDIETNQYNLAFTYYPFGNLNLYGISRFSQKEISGKRDFIFGQIIGVKTGKSTWLEGLATIGEQNHFSEADNLYIFNGIDATKFKTGATFYYLMNSNLRVNINYTYEQKTETNLTTNYNQHSLTTGLTWKF